jgi:histidyl-tRNA synthetase
MKQGVEELTFILEHLSYLPEYAVKADLSIVRGLDYYTGTVYETRLLDIPEFTSSVCSGGRYDDLAGSYINKHLPGVGISIGFTRLFDVLRHNGYIKNTKKCPTDVLVILPSDDMRTQANTVAHTLRQNGNNVEVYHASQKIDKQIGYANKKGIRYICFPELSEIKDLDKGIQSKIDVNTWKAG